MGRLLIGLVVDYSGELLFDPSNPDGASRNLLDASWFAETDCTARTRLRDGLESSDRQLPANKPRLRA
jgi:hypothetical protein